MTDKLAEIRARLNGCKPDEVWYAFVPAADCWWLVNEIQRLRTEIDACNTMLKAKRIINVAGTSPESAHIVRLDWDWRWHV